MSRWTRWATALACVALVGACDDDTEPGDSLPEGCDHYLTADATQEAVQTQLIEVSAGETVCFAAGTYAFTTELSLSVDGVTLRGEGMDQTILDFSAQDFGANGVSITGDGVTVEDLQVKDAHGDGLRAQKVAGITFRRVKVWWTADASSDSGAYGLYPVEASNVLVEGCVVKGASDAGIYVGQSRTILVRDNEVFGNVAGIEIENSVDAEVVDNHAHDNVGGLLVFNLPELPMKEGERTKVHGNVIENNNVPNFGRSGSIVSLVPGGTGSFIMAADRNEFTGNTFRGNQSAAMMIISYIPALFGPYDDAAFDEAPEGNYLHGNVYEDNGAMPMGILADLGLRAPGPDILIDGCFGEGQLDTPARVNCIEEDASVRFLNLNLSLCGLSGNEETDVTPFVCAHASLPAQTP